MYHNLVHNLSLWISTYNVTNGPRWLGWGAFLVILFLFVGFSTILFFKVSYWLSLSTGPLFKYSLISLRVKLRFKIHLYYFCEAFSFGWSTVSTFVYVVAHLWNSPHLSICLILSDVIQMLGKLNWCVHYKTSTWNPCLYIGKRFSTIIVSIFLICHYHNFEKLSFMNFISFLKISVWWIK